MSCNCEGKTYNLSFGCCEPVLAPIENYYTKYQVDKLIESATTSGCCITPEEVDEKIASAKTEIENEIPSLSGYATEQWVLDKHYISGVDLSDYALKSEIPTVPTSNTAFTNDAGYLTDDDYPDLASYATKEWVINQKYVSNSELIQYITNLQNQIDSLKEQISGCCGSTGETITRWITMIGANDYTCSGTTKYTKEKEQQSIDGGNTWTDTGNYRSGSTVLEVNSVDCGYIPPIPSGKFTYYYNGNSYTIPCNSSSTLSVIEIGIDKDEKIGYTGTCAYGSCPKYDTAVIGNCVTRIGNSALYYETELTAVTIPTSVTEIGSQAFDHCESLSSVTLPNSVVTIENYAFAHCNSLTDIIIPEGVTTLGIDTFDYCDNLTGITIPSTVTSIGDESFYVDVPTVANQHRAVIINAITPPTLGINVFDAHGMAATYPIYVPAESLDAYKAATNWSSYASRIQAIQ